MRARAETPKGRFGLRAVTGLTVKDASLEGILAEPPLSSWPKGPTSAPANISHVTIAGNVVVHND